MNGARTRPTVLVHDAAVTFAADYRVDFEHLVGDIRLADGGVCDDTRVILNFAAIAPR